MNKKIAIALIALVGIGLYALPQTMALFAGQHSFVNIDPTGNQVKCDKCHGDVQAELQSNVNSLTGTKAPHADMECSFCHRLQIGQSSGDSAYAIVEYQGVALKIPGGNVTTVRRYLVMKTADYEAQKYPANVSNNDSVRTVGTMATAGGSLSPLYGPGTLYDYSATVFAWNGAGSDGKNRSRQTDIIENGVGTVSFIARGTILALYNNGTSIDQNATTKDDAFNPALVTWNTTGITKPDTQPAVILEGAGSRTVNSGSRYHAASLVACMDCHAGSSPQPGHETARLGETTPDDITYCAKCHYGTEEPGSIRSYQLSAGGFGGNLTNEAFDSGSAEVHKPMATAQDSISVYGGRFSPASNDGCIACHTHVDVEITYHRPTTLQYTATENNTGGWSTTDFVAVVNSSFNTPGSPAVGGVSTG